MSPEKDKFRYDILNSYNCFRRLDKDEVESIETEFEIKFYHGYLKNIFGDTKNIQKDTIEEDIDEMIDSLLKGVDTGISGGEFNNFIIQISKQIIEGKIELHHSDKDGLFRIRDRKWLNKAIYLICKDGGINMDNYLKYSKSINFLENNIKDVLYKKIKERVGLIMDINSSKVSLHIKKIKGGKAYLYELLKKDSRKRLVELLKK